MATHIGLTPHDTVSWGLFALSIKARFLKEEEKHPLADLAQGVMEAMRLVMVSELMREIELTLKWRIERRLRLQWDQQWWNHLPQSVRRNVKSRRRWAANQLGDRRVLGEKDITWLSMGDVLQVLARFSASEWQSCLDSETRRRRDFERALRKVKAYRDYHLAHPKPRRTTLKEQAILCSTVASLPCVIRPQEWAEVERFLEKIAAVPSGQLSGLREDAWRYSKSKSERLDQWLACPDLEPPEFCHHDKRLSQRCVRWRQRVLTLCEDYDPGGVIFFQSRATQRPRTTVK